MRAIVYALLFALAVARVTFATSIKRELNDSEISNSTTNIRSPNTSGCYNLQTILEKQGDACRCYNMADVDDDVTDKRDDDDNALSADDTVSTGVRGQQPKRSSSLWVGCTRDRMPMIYRSLNAVPNDTRISKLWIWDSLIPLIPQKFFFKIRTEKLILENNHMGELAPGVLTPMADSLRSLVLRNNIVTKVDKKIFTDLNELRTLDLSGNLLVEFNMDSFGALINLRVLNLHNNKAQRLVGAAFGQLTNLKHLNLARNELTSIESDAFDGLANLNSLSLERNKIQYVAAGAFDNLPNLKHLNLGSNRLTAVALPSASMTRLKHLFLHDNDLSSTKSVALDGQLVSLQTLHLDKNRLTSLESRQFLPYANLRVLSLASNKIAALHERSLDGLKNLTVLSLQDNRIDKIPNDMFTFTPSLERLLLSQNGLTTLNDGVLIGLNRLSVISLAHNRLQSISPKAFAGLHSLKRLYLNDNFLSELHENVTSSLAPFLFALDLSDNLWECDCALLWMSKWIDEHEQIVVNGNDTICQKSQQSVQSVRKVLEENCRNVERRSFDDQLLLDARTSTNAVWVTVVGVILGVVTVFILITIAALYIQDGGRLAFLKTTDQQNFLKRVPSDMVNLLPNELTIREK